MIEIPPRFSGSTPVGPKLADDRQEDHAKDWSGARGLGEDVRRYGAWMRAQAEKRIGQLYPKITVTPEMVVDRPDLKPLQGQALTIIAWLWTRTVRSPNPAFSHIDVPLASTFVLSSKDGKQVYVEPVIEGHSYKFIVKTGTPTTEAEQGTAAGKRGGFYCLLSGSPIDYKYIRSEGTAGRMGTRLMAIVAEGSRGRIYLAPTSEQEAIAGKASPDWRPEVQLHGKCRVNVSNYGLDTFGDLFTPRQLVALTTFSDLVQDVVTRCRQDAVSAGTQIGHSQRRPSAPSWRGTAVPSPNLDQLPPNSTIPGRDLRSRSWQSMKLSGRRFSLRAGRTSTGSARETPQLQ